MMTWQFQSSTKLEPGATYEFVPFLAESWRSNDDLSTGTFRLRDSVVFHDGSRWTTSTVSASFERPFALDLLPATSWVVSFIPWSGFMSKMNGRSYLNEAVPK